MMDTGEEVNENAVYPTLETDTYLDGREQHKKRGEHKECEE